jgi:hypothetical protein
MGSSCILSIYISFIPLKGLSLSKVSLDNSSRDRKKGERELETI